jgi:hypothetical protein
MGQPELISNARGSVDCDSSVSTRPRSNSAVKWNALQFHRTLFVRSNPDQDKQSTELRNAGGFVERNSSAEITETRV